MRIGSLWRGLVILGGCSLLVACGVGSEESQEQEEPNTVQVRSQVQQIAANDPRGFAEPATGQLVQSSGELLPEGAVLTLDGKALKVVRRTLGDGGSAHYTTTAPKLADLFERIRITHSVNLGPNTSATADDRAHKLATVTLPRTQIKPELGAASDFIELGGSIESGQGTVLFDWSLSEGLKQAELSLTGRLALNGSFGVKAAEKLFKTSIKAGTISVPIPVTGFAVSFDVPIELELTAESEISVKLASYTRAFDFSAGTRYDPSRSVWLNLSRFDDVGSNFSPLDFSSARAALQSLGNYVRAQFSNQGNNTFTLAKVTVVPSVSPSLVLMKSVVATGVRLAVATSGAVEATGVFPEILACVKVPLTAELRAIGFYDVPIYDLASPSTLLDPDLERSEFPLFTLTTDLPTLYTASGCNDGRPYNSTLTVTAATVPPLICGLDQNGFCIAGMFCKPDGDVNQVNVFDERWSLAADSLLAELQSAVGASESYSLRGTYQPTTGQITVTETIPFTETQRSLAGDGTSVVYYTGGESTLNATFDPVTGAIVGTGTSTSVTRWSRDIREARCETKFNYRSLPRS